MSPARSRRAASARRARSDWMKIEQQRGISVTTSVMTFEYDGAVFNLLDTPGHEDFCEDTYRTLTAVDSAVMVIDAAKGIEAQTRKLFEVCRLRDMPIITFINKMDREGQRPVRAARRDRLTAGARRRADDLADRHRAGLQGHLRSRAQPHAAVRRQRDRDAASARSIETLRRSTRSRELRRGGRAGAHGAIPRSTCESYREGHLTPVFFGSALQQFRRRASCSTRWPPGRRRRGRSRPSRAPIEPTEPKVAGFVFKVQANMDPNHRDRVAFLRLCSGKFQRGMKLTQIGHRQGRCRSTRRSCSSPASASSPTRPGPATSSASPTTACCASATR